ncbi:MAG: peptidylprolyl isomerase [Bryobacteraceae bacterium]
MSESFRVKFETSKGDFVALVQPEWAPLGAAQFRSLVEVGFYDGAKFFRVVPNFVVQFGLAADPEVTARLGLKPIPDDPVKESNRRGRLTFATTGPNTRTTQLFINLADNTFLDSQGFAPFAEVIEGMEVVDQIYPGHGEQPHQGQIRLHGNRYLDASFPLLDGILKAEILS